MSDEKSRLGTPWRGDELDAIITDYFSMRGAEISGEPYVKASHNRRLMAQLGRSHRSVELKYGNISAVLEALGLPWIRGYKPMENYQAALFPAVDRYLSDHPEALEPSPALPLLPPGNRTFVAPPPLVEARVPASNALRQLVGKYDPAARDERNRKLGKAGEEFVVGFERERLFAAGRSDLARRVRWVAEEDGDGFGYDVSSFELGGEQRFLEVKTTNGSARTPFFLTRNERRFAEERPTECLVYRVFLFATDRRIFAIAPPLERRLDLRPETWRASFVRAATGSDALV